MTEVSLVQRRAAVRSANQEIAAAARKLDFRGQLPLFCECGSAECRGFVRIDADAFDLTLTQPTWLLTGDAHGSRYAVRDGDTDDVVLLSAK